MILQLELFDGQSLPLLETPKYLWTLSLILESITGASYLHMLSLCRCKCSEYLSL